MYLCLQLQLKVVAEELFKDKKQSYQRSVQDPFVDSRLGDSICLVYLSLLNAAYNYGDGQTYFCCSFDF